MVRMVSYTRAGAPLLADIHAIALAERSDDQATARLAFVNVQPQLLHHSAATVTAAAPAVAPAAASDPGTAAMVAAASPADAAVSSPAAAAAAAAAPAADAEADAAALAQFERFGSSACVLTEALAPWRIVRVTRRWCGGFREAVL